MTRALGLTGPGRTGGIGTGIVGRRVEAVIPDG